MRSCIAPLDTTMRTGRAATACACGTGADSYSMLPQLPAMLAPDAVPLLLVSLLNACISLSNWLRPRFGLSETMKALLRCVPPALVPSLGWLQLARAHTDCVVHHMVLAHPPWQPERSVRKARPALHHEGNLVLCHKLPIGRTGLSHLNKQCASFGAPQHKVWMSTVAVIQLSRCGPRATGLLAESLGKQACTGT